MNTTDIMRELEKITTTLKWAEEHLTKDSESKAALHLSERVLYTPLCTSVVAAKNSALKLSQHFGTMARIEQENQ